MDIIHSHVHHWCVDSAPTLKLEWDQVDRLQKSLRCSGVGVGEMADYLGLSRNTVSGYLHGRIRPNKRTLMLWSMRTDVPLEWLRDGSVTGESHAGPAADYALAA